MTNPAYSIAPVGTVTRSEVSALTRRVWAALGAPQSDAATLVALRDEVSTALREIDRSGQQAARTISRHAPDASAMLRVADAMWIGRNLTSLLARLEGELLRRGIEA